MYALIDDANVQFFEWVPMKELPVSLKTTVCKHFNSIFILLRGVHPQLSLSVIAMHSV
jgi:hypothetical protein